MNEEAVPPDHSKEVEAATLERALHLADQPHASWAVRRLAAEVRRLSQPAPASEWRPIEGAPSYEEGAPVVLLCDKNGNRWTDVYPGDCEHNWCAGLPPIRWMPLPEPPK